MTLVKRAAATAKGAVSAGRESSRAYRERYDARRAANEPGEPLLAPRRTGGGGGGGSRRGSSGSSGAGATLRGAVGTAVSGPKYVRILKAEFLLCMVILALSPIADPAGEEGAKDAFRRCAACMGVFFLLGLVAAGGPKAGKAAAAGGGLITVALMVSSRDVFGAVATRITSSWPGAAGTSVGGAAGNAAGDIVDAAQAQADAAADNDDSDGGGGGAPGGVPDGGSDPTADWVRGPLPPPGL